ncbi:MAG: antibiotic biosynthesis monooxygenase [Chitinophagales bacterium]|nr:antibiotic biosynthesis monooxygenase [Chitinophagales bacterium]
MITRIWHGITKAEDAEGYLTFLEQKGVQDYLSTPGNLEVIILRSIEKDICHFLTVSVWQNKESIIAFAGETFDTAKYYPEDKDFLLEFEPHVKHYETFRIK